MNSLSKQEKWILTYIDSHACFKYENTSAGIDMNVCAMYEMTQALKDLKGAQFCDNISASFSRSIKRLVDRGLVKKCHYGKNEGIQTNHPFTEYRKAIGLTDKGLEVVKNL